MVDKEKCCGTCKHWRRQYMYSLRTMEKRGKELSERGITAENIEAKLFPLEEDDE